MNTCNMCGSTASDGMLKSGSFYCMECADYVIKGTSFTVEQIEQKLKATQEVLKTLESVLEKNPSNSDALRNAATFKKDMEHYERQLKAKEIRGEQ